MKIRFIYIAFILIFTISGKSALASTDLEVFVTTHYHHGVPVDQARKFGKKAVPQLIRFLEDEKFKQAWPNIIVMLGLLEDEKAVQPLVNFLEKKFTGPVDDITYQALVVVPNSIALASAGKNAEAEEYILKGMENNNWRQKGKIRWSYKLLSEDDQPLLLRKLSIEAAGKIGTEKARDALQKIKQDSLKERQRVQKILIPSIDKALVQHQRISSGDRRSLFEQAPEWN